MTFTRRPGKECIWRCKEFPRIYIRDEGSGEKPFCMWLAPSDPWMADTGVGHECLGCFGTLEEAKEQARGEVGLRLLKVL